MSNINFKTWLVEASKDNDKFVKLLKLMETDSNFPEDDGKDSILIYLRVKNAGPEIMAAFEEAWEEYTKSK